MFILDTNILILGLAGEKPESEVMKRIILKNNLVFSPIVVAEFLARTQGEDKKLLHRLLLRFKTVVLDENSAKIAAGYRQQFWQKKKKVFLLDCFIAASCQQFHYILVTNNVKDFPMEDIRVVTPRQFLKKIESSHNWR